ncbi:hypothetical protein HK097_005172 [Rhizophlyctis rosea]|uniref:Asparagine synthetase domain-containing protein n=1 Tax=Rhizophlyctis rosea TaxID=64517 RepID=A0AAD5SFN9_9FUNG|nr:hypothetical protein HK097_005172 [Rhizophlyctis rosea]
MESSRVQELRRILLSTLTSNNDSAILLSGGLDTSIITDLGHESLKIAHAYTLLTGPTNTATDETFAKTIANSHSIPHTIIRIPNTLDLVSDSPSSPLSLCVKVLNTFDPMELRNSVVVARTLQECAANNVKTVITGDGADELFAGYSFLSTLSPGKLRRWIHRISQNMSFSVVPLSKALGIENVIQPFLHPDVIQFALTCKKSELVGTCPETGKPLGKWILREAFPEAHSCWRRKDPIEVGSGTTHLPKLFETLYDAEEVEREKARIWDEDRIQIRDAEHLHYYRIFRRTFWKEDSEGRKWECGVERYGSDPCRSCGFQLQRPDQYFCVVCGEWPAREGGLPEDVEDGDDLDG